MNAYAEWLAARAEIERAQVRRVSPESAEGLALAQAEADAARRVSVWRRLFAPQAVTWWRVRSYPVDGPAEEREMPAADVDDWRRRAWRSGRYVRVEVDAIGHLANGPDVR